jgi:hypothetical protein
MPKIIAFILLLSLSGCSHITEFYIFNSTGHTITIEYQPREVSQYEVFTTSPRIVEFEKKTNISETENAGDIQLDPETNIVRCELKPNQALWIGSDMNFSMDNDYAASALKERLVYMTIKTGNETLNLTFANILDYFKTFRKYAIVGIDVK